VVDGQAVPLAVLHDKIQNPVARVFKKIFHLEGGHFVDPTPGVEEHVEDRAVAYPFELRALWRTKGLSKNNLYKFHVDGRMV
jgi:hypothetical protein